jgi:hypothetical protein
MQMHGNKAIALEEAFRNLDACFKQLEFFKRLLDDCQRRLAGKTDDPESWETIQRESAQLRTEWDLVFKDFMATKSRFAELVAFYPANFPARESDNLSSPGRNPAPCSASG